MDGQTDGQISLLHCTVLYKLNDKKGLSQSAKYPLTVSKRLYGSIWHCFMVTYLSKSAVKLTRAECNPP